MSTDIELVCDKCKQWIHLGQSGGVGFSFGYSSFDKKGIVYVEKFIHDHINCFFNEPNNMRVIVNDDKIYDEKYKWVHYEELEWDE